MICRTRTEHGTGNLQSEMRRSSSSVKRPPERAIRRAISRSLCFRSHAERKLRMRRKIGAFLTELSSAGRCLSPPSACLTPSCPCGAAMPSSAICARMALISCVRWRIKRSRVRCCINRACCSADFSGTAYPRCWTSTFALGIQRRMALCGWPRAGECQKNSCRRGHILSTR
jgi:hypothetical protein